MHVLLTWSCLQTIQIVQPHILPTKEELLAVHSEAYLDDFLAGTLPAPIVRRIGFNEIIHTETLVRRTLWECAGERPCDLQLAARRLSHSHAMNFRESDMFVVKVPS